MLAQEERELMAHEDRQARKTFALWKLLLPVIIGVGVVAWMFWRDASQQNLGQILSQIHFTPYVIGCVVLACLFMLGRDFGLSLRFRILTDRDLKWKQAIKVTYLCEFTSAVSPSAVGGSALGMVYLNREGIDIGRATTLMLTTLFLDELFLVVMAPTMILLSPAREIFDIGSTSFSLGLGLTFWLVYAGVFIYTTLLFLGILVKPRAVASFLRRLFSLPFLRRWKPQVEAMGDNMIATSAVLKSKPLKFWLKAFGATVMSWLSRYLVVNAIFLAFVPSADPEQFLILARQVVVWVLLMISPTPGGSGLSEWLFKEVYGALVPTVGLALFMAIFWRLISYYVYLIVGVCILPKWFTKFSKKQ